MKSKIIKLNDFLIDEKWVINSSNNCLSLSPNLEQLCMFLLSCKKNNKDLLLDTIYINKNGEILNKFNIIIGLYIFIICSNAEFNLLKIYKKAFEDRFNERKIQSLLNILNDPETTVYKAYLTVIKNFTESFEKVSSNSNNEIVSLFSEKIMINLVEVDDYDQTTFIAHNANFLEYITIAEFFKSKIFNNISSAVSNADIAKMLEIYKETIEVPYEKITIGQEWISCLDSYITHMLQIHDPSFLKFQYVRKNYLIWTNVLNMKITNFLNSIGYQSIDSYEEFQGLIDHVIQYLELLKMITTHDNWDIFGDIPKFIISQFNHLKLPIEMIANLLFDNTNWNGKQLEYTVSKEIDEKLLNMFKVIAKFLFVAEKTSIDNNLKFNVLNYAIVNYHWDDEILSLVKNIKEAVKNYGSKDTNPNKEHYLSQLEKFDKDEVIANILEAPILLNSPSIVFVGNILNLYEITTYNHSFEQLSGWAPFVISQHIFPNRFIGATGPVPMAYLGDIWFLDKASAEYVIATAKSDKPINASKLYFDTCQSFNYLMKDDILQKVAISNNWSNALIKDRTTIYKKMILDFLAVK